MRIGFYKPLKKIYFKENKEDHSSWSIECVNIMKILAANYNKVYILTETDYEENMIDHITAVPPVKLDRIFVMNGNFVNPAEEEQLLLSYNCPIDIIVTDLALFHDWPFIREKYSQSKQLGIYAHIEENQLFQYVPSEKYKKTIDYYFGGTERKRTKAFFEYIYRPNCLWKGKSQSLNIIDYVPEKKHLSYLNKTKTTIVIGDETYNHIGFVTPRFYECIIHNVVCFFEYDFDPDELIISKKSWFRVSSYQEFYTKQKQLLNNEELWKAKLQEQQALITYSMIAGSNIYNALKEM